MSVAVETSARLLASALAKLDGAGSATRLDAEVLLAHALDAPRTRLHAWPDEPVSAARAAHFRTLVARRADGEPVAHLTGRREFWSLSLEVTADTLIPRPETERLVEVALSLIAGDRAAAVAELGTGSGAVAAAIASERPSWRVVATDLCPRALAVAARNMARLGLDNVALRSGDWLDALAGERFALIVANPPYVACDDPHLGRGCCPARPWHWSTGTSRVRRCTRFSASTATASCAATGTWPATIGWRSVSLEPDGHSKAPVRYRRASIPSRSHGWIR
jgi:release factor glutamine methyltransferase